VGKKPVGALMTVMGKISGFIAGLGLGLAVLVGPPALAGERNPHDTRNFVVSGIKLGMGPQAVAQALTNALKPAGANPAAKPVPVPVFVSASQKNARASELCGTQVLPSAGGLSVEYSQSRLRSEFADISYISRLTASNADYLVAVEFAEKAVKVSEADPCKAFAIVVTGVSVSLRPGQLVDSKMLKGFADAAVARYGTPSFDNSQIKPGSAVTRETAGLYVWCNMKEVKPGTKTANLCTEDPILYLATSGTRLQFLDYTDYARIYGEEKARLSQTVQNPPF
jgi:hypothetical protein